MTPPAIRGILFHFTTAPRSALAFLGFTAVAAIWLCFLAFGLTPMLPVSLGVAALLLAISFIDLRTTEIPDGLLIALAPFAAAALFAQPHITLLSRGIGFLAVSVPLLALALVISGAFGGGDIKLMAVCGFLLGWQNVLLAFFIAVLLGGSYAVYLMLTKKRARGEHMVFGPALCAGVFTAMLYGDAILGWYLGLFRF
jgi:leader peptidase (prepilin peptidase)/N-methyltransferase